MFVHLHQLLHSVLVQRVEILSSLRFYIVSRRRIQMFDIFLFLLIFWHVDIQNFEQNLQISVQIFNLNEDFNLLDVHSSDLSYEAVV